MADALATLAPAEGPEEAPLDATAIRRCGREEEEEAPAAEAEAARCLTSIYEIADEVMDEWDSACAAISSGGLGGLDAYLEWLRSKVTVTEEMNRKGSDEIDVLAETTGKDMIKLDVGINVLESSLWKLDSKDLSHCEASPIVELPDSTDSCRNQGVVDREYKYEVLKLDQQIEKGEMDLKLLQNMGSHSFEYCDKEETIIAHLVRGIDVFMKTSADWPLSSYGLKLISIRNSGTHPTSITSSLLVKTKERANGLELQLH